MSWECTDPGCKQVNADSNLVCGRCNKPQYGPVICNYHFKVPDSRPFPHAVALLDQVMHLDLIEKLALIERRVLSEWLTAELRKDL